MVKNYAKILEECVKVANNRQKQYGEASQSMKLASTLLYNMFGVKLNSKELCYAIIAIKMSRQKFKFKKDSVIDIINYLAISLTCDNEII